MESLTPEQWPTTPAVLALLAQMSEGELLARPRAHTYFVHTLGPTPPHSPAPALNPSPAGLVSPLYSHGHPKVPLHGRTRARGGLHVRAGCLFVHAFIHEAAERRWPPPPPSPRQCAGQRHYLHRLTKVRPPPVPLEPTQPQLALLASPTDRVRPVLAGRPIARVHQHGAAASPPRRPVPLSPPRTA
jgi:hypothetical protein